MPSIHSVSANSIAGSDRGRGQTCAHNKTWQERACGMQNAQPTARVSNICKTIVNWWWRHVGSNSVPKQLRLPVPSCHLKCNSNDKSDGKLKDPSHRSCPPILIVVQEPTYTPLLYTETEGYVKRPKCVVDTSGVDNADRLWYNISRRYISYKIY